jgi:molybdopterin-guanine dinucleotide biosynthesis protein A
MNSAVILAGGESRRMQRDKMTLPFGASSLLASAVARFSGYFDPVYVSVNEAGKYPEIAAEHLVDVYKGCGPMGGLHAALLKAGGDGVFLTAADLPYSDPRTALRIIELSGDSDICITADISSRYEPLFGYYRKTVLPFIESALRAGDYKIAALFDKIRLRIVTREELGEFWQEKLLLNINYPEDYERLVGAEKHDF